MRAHTLWEIIWSDQAAADIDRLDTVAAERISAAIDRLAMTGYGDVRRLQAREETWRLRVGERRVILVLNEARETILIVRIKNRNSVYR